MHSVRVQSVQYVKSWESGEHFPFVLDVVTEAAIFFNILFMHPYPQQALTVEDSYKWTSFKYKNKIALLLGYLL